MYVDDPDVAFGSWCVRGAGALEDDLRWLRVIRGPGRVPRPIAGHEDFSIRYRYYPMPMFMLYSKLTDERDPRRQLLIQEAIERKRRADG